MRQIIASALFLAGGYFFGRGMIELWKAMGELHELRQEEEEEREEGR